MFPTLIKTEEIELEGQVYSVRYLEGKTLRGTQRYSAELALGPADRIIFDGSSLMVLESRVARLAPASIYSRILAARAA